MWWRGLWGKVVERGGGEEVNWDGLVDVVEGLGIGWDIVGVGGGEDRERRGGVRWTRSEAWFEGTRLINIYGLFYVRYDEGSGEVGRKRTAGAMSFRRPNIRLRHHLLIAIPVSLPIQ